MIELFLTRVRDVATSWELATASTDAVDPKALSISKSRVKLLFGLSSGREYIGQFYDIVRLFGDGRSSSNEVASTASFGERRAYREPVKRVFALARKRTFGEREDV